MLKLLSHGFDEVPTKVPMATFEQDLEDDFQFLPGEPPLSLKTHYQSFMMELTPFLFD